MKCPKCGYLGFKHVERCPNCGYDFSLTSSPALLDLSIRPSSLVTPHPLSDLALVDERLSLSSQERQRAIPEPVAVRPAAAPTPELPLFGSPIADDTPLITRPSPPRTPLALRRATPEIPRLRSEVPSPMLDLGVADASSRTPAPTPARAMARPASAPAAVAAPRQAETPAGVTARTLAVLIDVVLLAVIDIGVVYLTMEICGISLRELSLLPKVPLLAFLTVQNFSYFVLFTAGGQTMGQMSCGIKVIADDAGESPDLSRAMLRTMMWTILAVPAGLGLLTALLSADRRGLHDRFSGTRVVRAAT